MSCAELCSLQTSEERTREKKDKDNKKEGRQRKEGR